MKMEAFWIVVAKELRDALRDRRALMAGLLFALIGPVVMAAALKAMVADERALDTRALHVAGAAHAPGLLAHLRAAGVPLQPDDDTPESIMARVPGAVVLAVPPDAPRRLAQGRDARLALYADMADSAQARQARRVQGLVAAYGAQLSAQRLLGAGVAPRDALTLELRDMGGPGGRAALVLAALPVFWMLGLFVGGAHVALDATGGERERRSLEALLVQPVGAGTLFAAKWLTASLFGYASAATAVLVSFALLARLPLAEVGVAFAPDAALASGILLLLLPLALLVGALQCALALNARSQREGQVTLNLLQLAPMALMLEQFGAMAAPQLHLLPMFSQHAQMKALLAGQPLAPAALAWSLAGCLGLAALLLHLGRRRLGSERFVFGL